MKRKHALLFWLASGVDGICTDYPIDLLHYLEQKHYH